MKLNLRVKLYGVLGILAGLTVVASAGAYISFRQIGGTFSTLAAEKLPVMGAALTLSSFASDVSAYSQGLVNARITAARLESNRRLTTSLTGIREQLTSISETVGDSPELEELKPQVARIDGIVKRIDAAVVQRISLSEARERNVQLIGEKYDEFFAAIQPAMKQSNDDMDKTLGEEVDSRCRSVPTCLQTLSDLRPNIAASAAMFQLSESVSQMTTVSLLTARANDKAAVEAGATKYSEGLTSARDISTEQLSGAVGLKVRQILKDAAAVGAKDTGLFAVRLKEFEVEKDIARLLAENQVAVAQLTKTVEKLSSKAQAQASGSAEDSLATISVAGMVQFAIALISLAAVSLGWLYIGRQVINPIVGMAGAMRRIAAREWGAAVIGAFRTDEIGDIARAVEVFRENGQENERLQLEVERNRQSFDAERMDQERLIERSVGEVVAAAVAGDLSRKIDTSELQGVMQKLGDGVNSLLAGFGRTTTELNRVLNGMAHGDLTVRVDGQHRGVFAELQSNANETAGRLAEMVQRIASTAGTVREAAGEISSGTDDLSARTEQQAASLEETAASMHEITATVKQNAGSAEQANRLADAARSAAEGGGAVAQDAIQAMGEIEVAAQKIADIVGLIDEIAFQTNLLALNASVEAARAGEAGKGFAVVAQEVRALAQRSADASRDIKGLIATSNSKVKDGASLVQKAGGALSEIVISVKKVADIVAEIAAASGEQARGLEEVNQAVGNMDEMTQRNGALVEQTTASVKAMLGQADELHTVVRSFKV